MTAAILIENILQALVAGLLIGAIYGLMCVGLALIFGIMRVINFAQGDFMMAGMYCAFFIFGPFGISALFGNVVGPYVAAILAGPVLFVAGYLVHLFLVSRVSGTNTATLEGEGHYAQLILTLGLALILTNGAMILFGSQPFSVRSPLAISAWEIGPLWGDRVSVFVNKSRTVSALISVATIAALGWLVARSRLGKALRASADNPTAAIYMGIDVDRSHRIAFGLGIAITAIAGGLLATNYSFHPYVGLEYVIVMYAGVVLGGMGSIMGAFWGGMTIGLIQQMSTLVLPTQLQNTAIFVIFLVIVFFRPQGFLGRSAERT
ncbi:branched-chain amino acid ABC transporter permease [Chelativorans sp. SCAU2101]|jgi:Branched-chain amino acid ABC-type transport system, permease components|uniref:Branched-chain amino acid ABC transporter permease n=1 Tax=Chelativorans petroleitrophicus TaxID=2975484 RepID=A0A9X2X6F3_9HYPH|nr:branched-chain amino acid ABC transporter permease [Chelativorans petroleitrophicus]MCT8989071.1 branched-chain amino acid ABC transporter permease [Chelativorans petroleitrophicus]